jgi:transcriptional regulator with XRE-family HTH domain
VAANQKELAKLAGVSAGTVSNVSSGSTRVGESSRQKVLEAIRILNYQPNLIARSLKTNRTGMGYQVVEVLLGRIEKREAKSRAKKSA